MMKKKMCVLIAGVVLAHELTYTAAMAQSNAPAITPAIIAGGGSGNTGFLSAGNYDINQSVRVLLSLSMPLLKRKELSKHLATRRTQQQLLSLMII